MNHVLATTDTPFGKAVAALHFRRHTLSAGLLWRPLQEGWEMSAAAAQDEKEPLAIPTMYSSIAQCFRRQTVSRSARSWRRIRATFWPFGRRSNGDLKTFPA